MFDKAKLAMAMANPVTAVKVKRLSDWVDSLVEALDETDVEPPESEDFQDAVMTLLSKAKVKHLEDRNSLVIELGKKRKLRLVASFKVIGDE
ncbi:hypothetical protein TK1359 [Thermococcus kodakarensis KOD1]|uniref:Uncharacterized protein n=1 Tax=Thermococcus kodakarensis (strain ATCC BAA-918 / JCM 12380 / KOD1) TaxID=69014 RepID=Q5JGW3_THEKO|nr:hypothetical protein [Thermococcus kodakarensis]WCN27338.1 hypothetical protein POG15_06905 [Thermococcus kodakarensis]WCN29627.1 hypothetical protein POG21_06900 [Thermococcus kodakarensis]BAD85548.1 hypothetical protein TK1359 [Thermococcus kodakarensis KOD1]